MKVEIWFLLYLTKYHAMKKYRLLNSAQYHVDVLESGGRAPRIFKLITRRRWMVSFTPRWLYPGRNRIKQRDFITFLYKLHSVL